MNGGIYLLQNGDELVEMRQQEYDSEKILQEWLAKYPNLLSGDQIDRKEPLRWLLISREMKLASDETGASRWSVDHLFLDQNAVPTLVEVKRSTDTRIRREVVGQMLDYAANGVMYWPIERLRSTFEAQCTLKDQDPEEVLTTFLAGSEEDEADSERFWQTVKTNLQAGKIRLLFVADSIPPELRSIVEFLNRQMDPAEVLALEIKKYEGKGVISLVPQVIGLTAEAQQKKGVGFVTERQEQNLKFWAQLLKLNKERHMPTHIARNPTKENYLSGYRFKGRNDILLQYQIYSSDLAIKLLVIGEDKQTFDKLFQHKVEIERAFGHTLEWNRNDNKRSSSVRFTLKQGGLDLEESKWPELQDKLVNAMRSFTNALGEYL